MNTRKIKPYGYIYTTGEIYWYLLHPYPIEGDSWQRDNERRFVVAPINLGYARHIVSNDFTLEYRYNMDEIEIEMVDDSDLYSLDAINLVLDDLDDVNFPLEADYD
jgi:hypothetical protein